jgi:hypothetical protein
MSQKNKFSKKDPIQSFEPVLSDQQLIELIDFSIALEYPKKLFWRKQLPFLKPQEKQRLSDVLLLEKEKITENLAKKMRGVRGYYFARALNDLESEFLSSL